MKACFHTPRCTPAATLPWANHKISYEQSRLCTPQEDTVAFNRNGLHMLFRHLLMSPDLEYTVSVLENDVVLVCLSSGRGCDA